MAPNETTRIKRQPEVFTSIPNDQPTDKKPGQLSQEQLKHFFEKGYLILTDFIDHDLLRRLKLEWEGKANDLIEELYKSGKIKNKHEKEDFFHNNSFTQSAVSFANCSITSSWLMPERFSVLKE